MVMDGVEELRFAVERVEVVVLLVVLGVRKVIRVEITVGVGRPCVTVKMVVTVRTSVTTTPPPPGCGWPSRATHWEYHGLGNKTGV